MLTGSRGLFYVRMRAWERLAEVVRRVGEIRGVPMGMRLTLLRWESTLLLRQMRTLAALRRQIERGG